MFYCEGCAEKNSWPHDFWVPRSRGPCEVCGKIRTCVDVPSSALPEPKKRSRAVKDAE